MKRDPISNAIYGGIKNDIKICLDHKLHTACALLTFAGIDAMAFLNMPKYQTSVKKKDFVKWSNKYIKFNSIERLSGLELYGARCALIHNYGATSELARQGKVRIIGLVDQCEPPIIYNEKVNDRLVLLSIEALVDSFFNGIDLFLIDLFSNNKKCEVLEGRLNSFIQKIPLSEITTEIKP